MKNTGIQLNSDYDLKIQKRLDGQGKILSGLVIGDVLYQNQAMLLLAHEGEYREHPLAGVGLSDIANDNNFDHWNEKIAKQLEDDGQRITRLEINEKGLILEAKYN